MADVLEASGNCEVALRTFASGAIAGRIVDWPQLRPTLRWAMAEIDALRADLARVEQERDAIADARMHDMGVLVEERDAALASAQGMRGALEQAREVLTSYRFSDGGFTKNDDVISMIAKIDALAIPPTAVGASEPTPPCMGCGGPHRFDTSIPSALWNKVIRGADLPDYLCTSCIVAAFVRAGVSFTAELYGEPVNRPGDVPTIAVQVGAVPWDDTEGDREDLVRRRLAEAVIEIIRAQPYAADTNVGTRQQWVKDEIERQVRERFALPLGTPPPAPALGALVEWRPPVCSPCAAGQHHRCLCDLQPCGCRAPEAECETRRAALPPTEAPHGARPNDR